MGKYFQMPGQRGSVDDKGVVTWTIPYFVEDLADIFVVGSSPPLAGMKESGRTWSDIEGAGVEVTVEFEGVIGDPEDKEPTYDFDASFSEETLLSHPEWTQLRAIFKGSYDPEEKKITWPEYIQKAERALGDPGTGKGGGQTKNPMFGQETYMMFMSIFRHTYIRSSVSGDLFNSIGTIRQSLPGGFPTPTGRNWLVMPPKISQRGGVYQITEELAMSQPGGWPEQVYKFIVK